MLEIILSISAMFRLGAKQAAHEGGCTRYGFSDLSAWHSSRSLTTQRVESPAGSTGRCNTCLQFTRRRLKAQGLSRALIEAQGYLVEIGLRVNGQVCPLREVLS